MTKAYMAGFIAGTLGKAWEDCPYNNQNGFEYSHSASEWRTGQRDGFAISCGDNDVGTEYIGED